MSTTESSSPGSREAAASEPLPGRRPAPSRNLRVGVRRGGGFGGIWLATLALFACSPIIAPGSLGSTALLAMLPFAAILSIAAVGQTLVIQQGGLDLSVPGAVSLAAVIVTQYPDGDGSRLVVALLLVAGAAVLVGVLNGLLIGRLSITPLVATLGTGALLTGAVQRLSNGLPVGAPDNLTSAALDKTAGVPNTLLFAVVLVAVVALLVNRTVSGRRFRAAGANPAAAQAAGISVLAIRLRTYAAASLCYSAAGVVLAGFLRTPGITVGDSYLLPTIAAVVLGGTALTGGAGSVVATAAGALFLTQLGQLVLTIGAPTSVQLLIQGSIIALSVIVRAIDWPRIWRGIVGLVPPAAPGRGS